MKPELIRVVKGNHDLLGINFLPKGELYDFVIILNEEFLIHYIGIDGKEQTYTIENSIKNVHITYHSSKVNKNQKLAPELHVKKSGKRLNIYNNIIDIDKNSEFPIPLFKMTCNDVMKERKDNALFNETKNNVIDMEKYGDGATKREMTQYMAKPNINTVEIYFTNRHYSDYQTRMSKWPGLEALLMLSPIDYVVSGVDLRQDIVDEFKKGNIVLASEAVEYDQFVLLVKKYYDKNVNNNNISFYDNTNYIDMLATTPICLTTESGEQNRHYSLLYCSPFTAAYCDPFSGIFPAFCYDLDLQLEKNISFEKVNMWHNVFKKSLEKIQKYNIMRKGFIVPQE
jgi:hypothetical protein